MEAVREITEKGSRFLSRVQGETGIQVGACYQCERCTNSCPVAQFMDIVPHQVIRYIQLGRREELLSSRTIWVCLSCEMCTAHCPNEVGVAELIIYLRNTSVRSHHRPVERGLAVFYRKFLGELKRFGRINEIWLMGSFNLDRQVLWGKLRRGELLEELRLAYNLILRGRLGLIPRRSRAAGEIRELQGRIYGGLS